MWLKIIVAKILFVQMTAYKLWGVFEGDSVKHHEISHGGEGAVPIQVYYIYYITRYHL